MPNLLERSRAFAAAMTCRLTPLAIVSVGTDEHPAALIVGDDLVEIGIFRTAQRAWRVEAVSRERMVLEVERHYGGVRRDCIDALFAAGAEQLQRRAIVHL